MWRNMAEREVWVMSVLVNISDVCSEIFAGGDASKSNMSEIKTDEYKIPIFSNGEANDGLYGYTNFARVTQPSITVSARGTIGFVAVRSEPFVPIVRLISLTPIPEKIEIKYLYYALQNYKFDGSGTSIPQLTVPMLKKYSFPLPPNQQQLSVVAQLDKICNLISLRKQQLSKLDELVKARFVELFGDGHDGKTQLKMLGSICKFQQGTQIPVEEQFEEQISGYKRFLRIIDYTQAPQPPRYVNVNGKEVDEKSVVIVRYGATAGFVGRGYQGILANNLFEIMPNETMLSKDFLFLALKYGTFEKDVHDKAFGAAMPALSFSMMNDIPVVVPTEELQRQFVTFVEQVDKSKFEIQKSLEKLETLKKALMQKYFG